MVLHLGDISDIEDVKYSLRVPMIVLDTNGTVNYLKSKFIAYFNKYFLKVSTFCPLSMKDPMLISQSLWNSDQQMFVPMLRNPYDICPHPLANQTAIAIVRCSGEVFE